MDWIYVWTLKTVINNKILIILRLYRAFKNNFKAIKRDIPSFDRGDLQ